MKEGRHSRHLFSGVGVLQPGLEGGLIAPLALASKPSITNVHIIPILIIEFKIAS